MIKDDIHVIIDFIIPTKEEMEEMIKHITETGKISLYDEIVLSKMFLCKMIINNSHILIRSNKIDNVFINNIIDLNNLFICDFKNDYYILSGVSKSLGKTK